MALIKCPECGKEISDTAEVCVHCGYPLKKMQKNQQSVITCPECNNIVDEGTTICPYCGYELKKVNDDSSFVTTDQGTSKFQNFFKERRNLIIIAVVIILLIIIISNVLSSNKFNQYTKLYGQSYDQISDNYEMVSISDTLWMAVSSTEDIFGLPGTIQYVVESDENSEDNGNIISIYWISNKNTDLTQDEIDTFINGMISTYGNYNSEEYQKAGYSFEPDKTVYTWESKGGFDIKLYVYEDMSKVQIVWNKPNDV